MNYLKGYTFIVDFGKVEYMFGKNSCKYNGKKYENLESNGLTLYETLIEAIKGGIDFIEKMKKHAQKTGVKLRYPGLLEKVRRIDVAELEMKIADSEKELKKLVKEESLIVIKKEIDSGMTYITLHGEYTKGRRGDYFLPSASLYYNGFKPFKRNNRKTAFERACYLIREINKQTKCQTALATFKLELL